MLDCVVASATSYEILDRIVSFFGSASLAFCRPRICRFDARGEIVAYLSEHNVMSIRAV